MDAQIASSGSQCRLRTIECNPPKNRPKGKNTGEPQSKWQGQVLIPDQAIFQWTSEMAAFISFRNCKMAAFMYLMRNFHWTPFLEFWPTPTSAVTSFSSCGLHSACLCIFIWCRFNGHWKKEKRWMKRTIYMPEWATQLAFSKLESSRLQFRLMTSFIWLNFVLDYNRNIKKIRSNYSKHVYQDAAFWHYRMMMIIGREVD